MAIKVALQHHTEYNYDRLVEMSPQVIRLRPAPHSRTPIEAYSLKISPQQHFINWQQDPFGNYLARVVFPEKTDHFHISVDLIANLSVINPFDFFLEKYAEEFPFVYPEQLKKELIPYLEIKEKGPLLKEFMKKVSLKKQRTVDFLVYLNQLVNARVDYTIRLEHGVQTCEETLEKSLGSCRDSGWLLVQMMRQMGLAARFVSGYLVQLKADQEALDGPSGTEEDFTDLHAWAEVYIPGAGWVGLDATSGLFAGEGHIPLSCTPDPVSAAPITGSLDPCETEFAYENKVTRLHEDPRVTKPYSEEQWKTILALGERIDEDMIQNDVRLSMGGEPTFVSIDDMEAEEWNTAADGNHKRQLANVLLKRLKDKFGQEGFLHFGQGKLYPGEPLPRWVYTCYWRRDGKALWHNPALLATKEKEGKLPAEASEKFIKKLADTLKVSKTAITPAYEDVLYFLWEEGKVPIDKDPLKSNLKDPIERRTLAQHLERGLDEPSGFVLPIRYSVAEKEWQTCTWEFRREQLFLIPGNSPIGLRLPLDSLPESNIEEETLERSPLEPLPELDDFQQNIAALKEVKVKHPSKKKIFKTALCVEVREGILHVFFPPFKYAEHYLELMTAVEMVVEKLKMPVILEGYEPPFDKRLQKIQVTPDPGVIEVNVHPSTSWKELVHNTTTLYEEARQSRLGTEKFDIDGRHTGTGGGNHITLGGIKPEDSPLLRRPDLLQSLITFWQHHPGLSYLFASSFIGPTSQAPRVDEGRDEMLYELEIAFSQIPDREEPHSFWLVDRLFRNLLIDLTGNTHRAEFCIDKLYSPYGSTGRLGILELRGFDMPPHAQMSLVQNLLIRALVSIFWKKPYKKKLVRWGSKLHDRFLLEHYVREDFREVCEFIAEAGYPFSLDWFDAFFEFRFPVVGSVQYGTMRLELRMAIEPWHVLGEEVTSQGTARYVDSSVERIQVKLTGFTNERYIVICNGNRIPVQATGVKGEFVAGIRYKAWGPPSALHPTVGTDVPLVFDIIDTWNGRSIGGCTYTVAHPGGRSYDTFPVNAYEAEARRATLFNKTGHTPGTIEAPVEHVAMGRFFEANQVPKPMEPPKPKPSEEFPLTLDLRRN